MQIDQREIKTHFLQKPSCLFDAGGLGDFNLQRAQVRGETFAQSSIVLEQENFATGGKRGCVGHRPDGMGAKNGIFQHQTGNIVGLSISCSMQ